MTIQIRFQPTLFIYIGTTSGQIGWRVKQLRYQAYGEVPILRDLWIDIDADIDAKAKPWFKSEERVELAGLNPANVLKNLANYPHIKAWWPDQAVVKAGMLAGGGSPQQMRLVGRLAFFRMFNDRNRGMAVIDKLRSATEALFEIENIRQTEAKSTDQIQYSVEQGCRIVIVFSPSGGTGSSMAFDVAYLCRYLLEGQNPTVISINILPSVIDKAIPSETQTQKEKVRANAYAWFKEDNYLIENPYWRVEYPELATVEVVAPPFDYRFLIDIENQAGYRLNDINDVYHMIAQAIFMDTGSSIGGAMRGFTANVMALGEPFEGMRRAYSSLAAATLRYPKDRLLAYCANRLAKSLMTEGFLAEPKSSEVAVTASALLSQLKLRDSDLLGTLMEDARIKMTQEPTINKSDSVATALSYIDSQEAQNQTARRNQADQLKKTAQVLLQQIQNDFDREITKIAAMQGIRFALAVLDKLIEQSPEGQVEPNVTSFDGLQTRIQQQGMAESDLDSARKEYERTRKALKSLDDGPEDVLERLVNRRGWNKKFALFKNDCLAAMREINETAIQLAAQGQADGIYVQLAAQANTLKSRLESAANFIEQVADDMGDAAEREVEKSETQALGYEFLREVAVDFPAYYEDKSASINPGSSYNAMIPARAIDKFDALDKWVREGLRESARTYAEGFFREDLETTSLLVALQQMAEKDGQNPQKLIRAYLDDLIQYCHPFWQYDQNRGLHDIEGKSIIGVEEEGSPLIPEAYRNNTQFEIKTTGFRDRIDVMRVWHGLPAFMLRGMNEYKHVYERKRKGIDPLHVLPGMEFAPDIMPEEGQRNREMFAIGLVFDYIVQVGSWYYYDPERRYISHKIQPTREFRLTQGRENAEEEFSRRDEWVQKVDAAVEAEVRQMGNEAAIKKLDDCIESHLAAIAKMTSEDTLRKQYEKEVRAFRNMQRRLGKVA